MKSGLPEERAQQVLAVLDGVRGTANAIGAGQKIGGGQFVPVGVPRTRYCTLLVFRTRRFWPLRP